ncbi:MAG: PD40 domain-containing protein, partial [Proteobacteria bacterium]|nr:PD40 domain-containing protein [Pseudomonadota bacterium]
MKKHLFIPKLFSISLMSLLTHNISHAMPGMHDSGSGAVTEHPRVSNSIGGKINTAGSEMEITYSADGKTAIFVSTRAGSIPSPGGNY